MKYSRLSIDNFRKNQASLGVKKISTTINLSIRDIRHSPRVWCNVLHEFIFQVEYIDDGKNDLVSDFIFDFDIFQSQNISFHITIVISYS